MILKSMTCSDTWCVPVIQSNVSLTFTKIKRKKISRLEVNKKILVDRKFTEIIITFFEYSNDKID